MLSLQILCWGAILLVVYHHLLYPVLLRWLAGGAENLLQPDFRPRGYASSTDEGRPRIGIIVPCYNEAEVIADKLQNLASLDYPADRLGIYIICDGCSDATADRARDTAGLPPCAALNIQVIEHRHNRGKLVCLNEIVATLDEDLLMLTDASALLSLDCLLIASAHFDDPQVGAVCGSYALLHSGDAGQSAYWRYQIAIKQREAAMASTLGAHGACYLLRRRLYRPPPADIINDDFVIPMYVVRQGYCVRYEPRILALELEQRSGREESGRRRRLSMGNVQMAVHLADMLHPRHGAVAFNFFSGKFLRAFMPLILLIALLLSALLGMHSPSLATIFGFQVAAYTAAFWHHHFPAWPDSRLLQILHYLVSGHWAGAQGLIHFLFLRTRPTWQ